MEEEKELEFNASRARLASRFYSTLQSFRSEQVYENCTTAAGAPATLSASPFSKNYPRFPDPNGIQLSRVDSLKWLDLRPYMDSSPVTVHLHAPLERAHRLFLQMGLRHLIVVDDGHNVVGIITRKELTKSNIEALAAPFGGGYP